MLLNLLTMENGRKINKLNVTTPKSYTDNFYSLYTESSLASAKAIIPMVLEFIKPLSVLDIGCSRGEWLSVWKKYGVKIVMGYDGPFVKQEELLISKEEFSVCDLEKEIESKIKYDIVTCLEVAEHLKPEAADRFINSLCLTGDFILFSAAIPGQEGTLHFNEQYPDYWINLFQKNNFDVYDCLRENIWNNKSISSWYRQNVLIFIRKSEISKYPLIPKNKTVANALIHPEIFEYKLHKIANYERILRNPITAFGYFLKKYINTLISFFKK